MTKLINVAFIIDSITTRSAGTEKQLLMLINKIDRKKIKPHLVCLRSSEFLEQNEVNCDVEILEVNSLLSLSCVKGMHRLNRIIKDEQIDVIQTYFKDGNLFGTIAGVLNRVKVLISCRRNYGSGYWHNRKWLLILKLFTRWTTMYVANSKMVESYTLVSENVNKKQIRTIYNGLDLETFKRITPSLRNDTRRSLNVKTTDILIGLVANWRPVKNIPLFIKVASKLNKQFNNIKFIILGKPPNAIDIAALETNVTFIGEVTDVIPYLSAMDIGVLCSSSESLSNSITEYLAAGLPCVVSNVGGNYEAIGDGYGGLVFENNNLEEFCDKLILLILDAGKRHQFALNAKKIAFQRYDYLNMVKAYEDMYIELVSNR